MPKKIKYRYNENRYVNAAFDFIKTIVFVMAVVALLFTYFIRDVNVVGSSMYDTLHAGDKVILTTFNYTPKSGDIVAINTENLIEKRIIKRVIATEGQLIDIDYKTGDVYVDGIIISEDYLYSATNKPDDAFALPCVVPENHIFVMGDNRLISFDSRDTGIGLVSCDDIIGKAQFVFYPFDRVKYIY